MIKFIWELISDDEWYPNFLSLSLNIIHNPCCVWLPVDNSTSLSGNSANASLEPVWGFGYFLFKMLKIPSRSGTFTGTVVAMMVGWHWCVRFLLLCRGGGCTLAPPPFKAQYKKQLPLPHVSLKNGALFSYSRKGGRGGGFLT